MPVILGVRFGWCCWISGWRCSPSVVLACSSMAKPACQWCLSSTPGNAPGQAGGSQRLQVAGVCLHHIVVACLLCELDVATTMTIHGTTAAVAILSRSGHAATTALHCHSGRSSRRWALWLPTSVGVAHLLWVADEQQPMAASCWQAAREATRPAIQPWVVKRWLLHVDAVLALVVLRLQLRMADL